MQSIQREECVGCKTLFEEGSRLPLEGISIELKNYSVPIKDQRHKWNLLRTICSLLNSKGGTIFIGAEDQTGEVKGISIQRKDQDDFKIFIQQLTERIQPKVDLSDRQDIIVQFIPVVSKGKFLGKSLIKIIVKQGEPSQLYCFSQKVQLLSASDKKMDEFQIVYSYKRINMGNIKELKGYQLVAEAKSKAAKPYKVADCFHQGCNPQPLNLFVQILKFGFSKIPTKELRQVLKQWFEIYLNEMQISDVALVYDEQNDMIVVEIPTKKQFLKVEEFINKNLNEMNENLSGHCHFVKKDVFLDCILYENTMKPPKKQKPQEIQEIKEKYKKYRKKEVKEMKEKLEGSSTQQIPSENEKKQPFPYKKQNKQWEEEQIKAIDQPKQRIKKQIKVIEKMEEKSLKNSRQVKQNVEQINNYQSPKKISKKYSFTFTHINPNAKIKENFINFLQILIKGPKLLECYQNTIQIFLPNEDKLTDMFDIAIFHADKLSQFGFKNEIRCGVNTGEIDIQNFNIKKANEIQAYLRKLIGNQLKTIDTQRKGNRHSVVISFYAKQNACVWLDKLLSDKKLKDFRIPGAELGQKPKMKIFLKVFDPIQPIDLQMCL